MKQFLSKQGLILTMVLIVGAILLVFGVTLHRYVNQQNANMHVITAGEVAHFLAEAGISSCIRTIRDALLQSGLVDPKNAKLRELLLKPGPLADTSLMPFLKDTWNEELAEFAREVDKTASIKVEVWLRGFEQTETELGKWVDPTAKRGWLSIESTGKFRNVKRTLKVRRKMWVGNVLPPVVSKFTLHLRDANLGNPNGYNIIRNDYAGNITDGPRPIICLNHSTPDSFFPFDGKPISTIQAEEKDPNVYLKRGWIWLGGGTVRLNLTSGSGELGEIFHFYDVSTSNSFQAVKFKTPYDKLPQTFRQPVTLPWDLVVPGDPNSLRHVTYEFEHSFVLDGFHDRSNRREHDAMYEKNILSRSTELPKYGSKSSMLHLFGMAKLGYQSRTKVFGNVIAAFPRFASLDIKTDDPQALQRMSAVSPPLLYLLPSLSSGNYRDDYPITDFLGRRAGGPILGVGVLFRDQAEYAKYMSCIVEMPYVTSYNSMQDTVDKVTPRQFPPKASILSEDLGTQITLTRNQLEIYKGSVSADEIISVILGRVQRRVPTIKEFWDTFFDREKKALVLNEIVQIDNEERDSFFVPPQHIPYPLQVEGGGMIVLSKGNLILRGVQLKSSAEALTIVLVSGTSVRFETPQQNQVNIVAPNAELAYGDRMEILGTLCLRAIPFDTRTHGGFLRYREDQDPTTESYNHFYKIRINDRDTFWHE